MSKENFEYKNAMERLEAILERIDNSEMEIDELAENVQEDSRTLSRGSFGIVADVQAILVVDGVVGNAFAFFGVQVGNVLEAYKFVVVLALAGIAGPVGVAIGPCIFECGSRVFGITESLVESECSNGRHAVAFLGLAKSILADETGGRHDHLPLARFVFLVHRDPCRGALVGGDHKKLLGRLGFGQLGNPFRSLADGVGVCGGVGFRGYCCCRRRAGVGTGGKGEQHSDKHCCKRNFEHFHFFSFLSWFGMNI